MRRRDLHEANENRCVRCGGATVVEMDGIWSYRACARCGQAQETPPGALPFTAVFFPARG